MLLCFAYLFAVLIHGLMKMRSDTMEGVWLNGFCGVPLSAVARIDAVHAAITNNTSQGELCRW